MSKKITFTDKQIKEIFEHIDADGSGKIDKSECMNFFKQLGLEQSDCVELTKEVMKDADSDGDGKITFAELHAVLSK